MDLYSGCSIRIEFPAGYPLAKELNRLLESKFQGCKIEAEESAESYEPQAIESFVWNGSPMSSSQSGRDWTNAGQPFAPMDSNAGQFLLRESNEAIAEFLRKAAT